jgi:hypothetical protein
MFQFCLPRLFLLFYYIYLFKIFVFQGTLLISVDPVEGDWFRGKTLDGQVGTFHAGYCWQMDASNYRKFKIRCHSALTAEP